MTTVAIVLGLLATCSWPALGAEENESASRLIGAVKILAADEMEGRGIGTRGLDDAAAYIAEQFAAIGLRTDSYDGQPYQKFTIGGSPELGPVAENQLVLQGPGGDTEAQRVEMKVGQDFNPLAVGGSGTVGGEVVFVGYGITAPDLNYDDYANLDVKGKIVLMLRREPQQGDRDSVFDGTRSTPHATFQSKVKNAVEHGAAAVIMVNDDYAIQRQGERRQRDWRGAVDKLAEAAEAFAGKQQVSEEELKPAQANLAALAAAVTAARSAADADRDEVPDVGGAGAASGETIPVFFCRRSTIDQVLQSSLHCDLVGLEQQIDQGPTPRSQPLAGWTAHCQAKIVKHDFEVKNVIGVLEGAGALADETIVIGAHYDHVGMGGAGSLARGSSEVHNGADDNASGTAGVIELARRMAATSSPSRRRLVFIAFTGEERGLLGSAHYVKNPLFPLENTVAMLNMDMIGRLDDDRLTIGGSGTAAEFDPLIEKLNESYQFVLDKQPQGSGPSDHSSFYRYNVPVLFLFTGLHGDYHRPSDDYDKINVDGMLRVTDFAADILDSLDDAATRPTFQQTSGTPRFGRGRGLSLGVTLDMDRRSEGFVVANVQPGSSAEQGGVQAGDLIVQFGEEKIADRSSLMQAVRKYKAGDEVSVMVQRSGAEVTLKIKLQENP